MHNDLSNGRAGRIFRRGIVVGARPGHDVIRKRLEIAGIRQFSKSVRRIYQTARILAISGHPDRHPKASALPPKADIQRAGTYSPLATAWTRLIGTLRSLATSRGFMPDAIAPRMTERW